MSKYTPGPWLARIDGPVVASGQTIAEVFHIPGKEAETEANARLIGSAPDLLAVLQELEESERYWSEYDVPLGIVDRISAAIAKATGEKA